MDPSAWERFCLLVREGAGACDDAAPGGDGRRTVTAESRDYVVHLVEHHHDNIVPFLAERCGLSGRSVLEVGAGTAGLSVALIQAGVASVTGVEPNRVNHEAGEWRVRAHRMEDRISLHHVPDTARLPFPDGHFDASVCCSVLQYVPGAPERRRLLVEMERVVRPGGLVIVCGSGNGLFPGGPHSSRWWSNLAPQRAARRGHRRGITYWEIARALAPLGASPFQPEGDGALARWRARVERRGLSGPRLAAHRALVAALSVCEATVCRAARVPIEAFMPFPAVAFRKRAEPPAALGSDTMPHPCNVKFQN
ncbi:MAG: class I SAM-dependent methyltransferase [Polyangiaceae bacterium]|nr:class I SAM-dependent methyltransferase [Polyangiaceae bacterium]